MTQTAKLNRRQFLTGAFRGRDVASSDAGEDPALLVGLAPEGRGEHHDSSRLDEPRIGRDITAPDTAPQIPDWDEGMVRVLETMEDTQGIEDD